MRNARLALALAVVVGVTGRSNVAAQIRWGNPEAPRDGVCFYEDADFRGRSFCARAGEDIPEMPRGMNDRISSMRLFGPTEVVVFRDSRFRGESARFWTDVRNLRREGWNDIVSSVRVSRESSSWGGRGGRRPEWGRSADMPREGACFFKDEGFRGESFCVPRGASYPTLPAGFNDQITAVRVRGAIVMIFSDSDYRGQSRRINSDVANVGDSWNDRISSIRVF
jgi:peptidase inhibitor family I36